MKRIVTALTLLIGVPASAESQPPAAVGGRHFFDSPFPGGNGRACATCHIAEDHFALKPERVAMLPADDTLFRAVDADDPAAQSPTYDHVRAGLIRVVLTLAPNLDVIDLQGNVISNPTRTITVWRGVPTIENTLLTGPYQYDGRAPDFQSQALGALRNHAEVDFAVPAQLLDLFAAFEKTVFSSSKIEAVAVALALGGNPPNPDLEGVFPPGSDEAEGQKIFTQACVLCHGGARGNQVTSQVAHDQTFFALNPDGTPVFDQNGPVLLGTHQDDPFMNIGTSVFSYLTQPGTGPIPQLPFPFNAFSYIDMLPDHNTLDMPRYRIRFYTDATRTVQVVDLPPLPQLGLSPSFVPQIYSVDPGACIITGDPADFEAFEAPQLRGLAQTAPYFHDGSMKSLEDVVEFYSSRVFVFVTAANLPPIFPSLSVGGEPETMSPEMKRQLVAFLKTL